MKDKILVFLVGLSCLTLLIVINISISVLMKDKNDKPIRTVQSPTPTVTITKTVKVPSPKKTVTRKVEVNRYPMCPEGMLSGDITSDQSSRLEAAGSCIWHP